jgi:hypothetical protein
VLAAALMIAGCSSRHAAAPRKPAPKASSASPAATQTSAFCLDLTTFQVGAVVYRADVLGAAQGRSPDIGDLKKRAAIIGHTGKEMRASAPPDIAARFRAVLDAISISALRLKPGAKVREIVTPLFNEHINPAFDSVDKYKCR